MLPIDKFSIDRSQADGHCIYCKECKREQNKKFQERAKQRKANALQNNNLSIGEGTENPLSAFKPRELIEELRRRGYKGKLSYTYEIAL